jgi:ubiquinone/menaquinone biosynthesis C-methylase UbiE
MELQRLSAISSENLPWGGLFATRFNFEFGYLTDEECLVTKYLDSPDNVLVIGSGNGREARPIHRQAKRIVCIDIGPMYLMSGQQLFKSENINNTFFVQADMFHLPFAKESFDYIFFSLYSFSGERRFEMLKNLRSVLRPSGLVLLTCCTPRYPKVLAKAYPWTVFISTAKELRREVCSCGFELIETIVDKKRPGYRFAILRPNDINFKSKAA